MGTWYFKQPNGRYGRFSTVVDDVTDCNLTEETLLGLLMKERGEDDIAVKQFDYFLHEHVKKFGEVLNSLQAYNWTDEEVQEWLVSVGMPEDEARKCYFLPVPLMRGMDYDTCEDYWDTSLQGCEWKD